MKNLSVQGLRKVLLEDTLDEVLPELHYFTKYSYSMGKGGHLALMEFSFEGAIRKEWMSSHASLLFRLLIQSISTISVISISIQTSS